MKTVTQPGNLAVYNAAMPATLEASKDLVKRYCEEALPRALKGDRSALHSYLTDDFVQHTAAHHEAGKVDRERHQGSIEEGMKMVPDGKYVVDRYLAEGDYVLTQWHVEGTHSGRHKHRHAEQHVEPTNAVVDIEGMTLYRLTNDKIAECWVYDTHIDFLIRAGALKLS
ncbi:MAG TPA: ester cyclase [Chloroflexota bacterium]|nr:ester cyclase [Chloroflexota bacterium]